MTFAKTRVFLKKGDWIDLESYRTGLNLWSKAPKDAPFESVGVFLRREDVEALYGHLGRFLAQPRSASGTLDVESIPVVAIGRAPQMSDNLDRQTFPSLSKIGIAEFERTGELPSAVGNLGVNHGD